MAHEPLVAPVVGGEREELGSGGLEEGFLRVDDLGGVLGADRGGVGAEGGEWVVVDEAALFLDARSVSVGYDTGDG